MDLPKVLIVNQPFVSNTGGGITLSNLFSGWDPDKLAVVCLGYILNSNIDPKVCNNYYQLGHEERKWMFPFNLLGRKYPSGPIRFNDDSKKKVIDDTEKSSARVGLVMKYVNPTLDYLGFSHFISKITLSKKLKDWLDDYNPDVVYAQCSSRESILFCIAIQQYLKKPSIHHVMDDWPSVIGVDGLMGQYWQKKINKEFQSLLDITHVHMGISDYMAEAYKKRYGKTFLTFHNPIDINFWHSGQRTQYELSDQPTVLYAGRIGLGIDTSLRLIAEAIAKTNESLGISIRFIVQAQTAPSWLKDFNFVEHKSFVAYEQLPKEFGAADVLVLPYDFSARSLAYIKYSMPTKASEYMASGSPILIFAPEDTALVHYATQHDWATLVIHQNLDALITALKNLFSRNDLRENTAERAKTLAQKRHDTGVVAKNFQNIVIKTACSNFQE